MSVFRNTYAHYWRRHALRGVRNSVHCMVAASLCLLPTPALADITNQAIVSGVTPRNTVVTSPIAEEIIFTAPRVGPLDVAQTLTFVDVDASGGWSVGDRIDIAVTGNNTSGSDLSGPIINSVFTANAAPRTLDAPDYTLQSGDAGVAGLMERDEAWVWSNSYTITQADIDGGASLSNVVTVSGTSGTQTASGQDTDLVPVEQLGSLAFTKAATSTSFVNAGEPINWALTVLNDGNLTLSTLAITDVSAASITCPTSGDATIATLAPQASEVCQVQSTVTAQNVTDGEATNNASIAASLPSGVIINRNASATLLAGDADLVTTKTLSSDNQSPQPGNVVVYTISVLNNGPATAQNTTLTDLLPAGLQATANNGAATQGSYDPATGIWSIGSLPTGTTATLTLEGTVLPVAAGTSVENTTTVATSDQADTSAAGDALTVTITPAYFPLIANDDTLSEPVNSVIAVSDVIDILANDTLNALRVPPAAVLITTPQALPQGITISSDGLVSVAANTAAGRYVFDYQLCEAANPANCSTATVSLDVVLFAPPIVGQLFNDNNNDRVLNGDDVALPDFTVQLVAADGTIVATDITDASGNYELSRFPPGTYRIVYIDPLGVGAGQINSVDAAASVSTDPLVMNLPADPSGILYNSVSGEPVAATLVRLLNARQNQLLPDACLLPRQQSQRTDADGAYRFDIVVGAHPLCPTEETEYLLDVEAPLRFNPVPSANIPPQSGALSASLCPGDRVSGAACGLHDVNEAPPLSAPSAYYLRFLIALGDPDIIHNHVAIDPIITPATSGLLVSKTTDTPRLVRGDAARYSVDIANNGTVNYRALRFEDVLPQGMTFIVGSAQLDQRAVTAQRVGNRIIFDNISVPIGSTVTLTYSARVGANVELGRKVNRAFMTSQSEQALSSVSSAIVDIVPEPVFDCADVIGRVFRDTNRNGIQDAGEPGIDGARIATATGTLITVDEFGRYSVPCAELPDSRTGTNYILKLDERSLPAGSFLTTENPKVALLTAGKLTQFNFGVAAGRDVQIDLDRFAFVDASPQLSPELEAGLRDLALTLADEPSTLQLSYYAEGEDRALIAARLTTVQNRIETLMGANADKVSFETRIFE